MIVHSDVQNNNNELIRSYSVAKLVYFIILNYIFELLHFMPNLLIARALQRRISSNLSR